MSVNDSNFTSVFLKADCHANPWAERNFAGSNWYVFKQIFLMFSKTPAKSNVSLLNYKSWYSHKLFISKSLQTLFPCM